MAGDDEPPLGYAGPPMERAAERRDDAAFADAEARDAGVRFALFAGDRPVVRPDGADGLDTLFSREEAERFGAEAASYLGRLDGAPVFAANLPAEAAAAIESAGALATEDLRGLAFAGRLEHGALALLGYAKAMTGWHARHRFCSNCGAPTESSPTGWRRRCPSCDMMHFPRVDPVVIMLVTHGGKCLLGRQSRFPPGMWSCLAGFVEPGETMEEAARREIKEEAGLALGPVAYELSQPWPFPSQLMIGVSAEALGDEITPDLDELEDARWFPRDEVVAMLARTHTDGLFAPPPSAIAHHLIRRFVGRAKAA